MLNGVVAAVTVGQAPREDLIDEMRALLPRARWIQHGALDEVGDHELTRLAPGDGEFPVVTRLRAGRPVIVGERAIRPLMQQAVDRVAVRADLVIVLCSTPMPLETRAPVLFPDRLLFAAVSSLGPGSKIAVLTPQQDQVALQDERWRKLGYSPTVICASPYGGIDFRRLGHLLRLSGASMVVLDCLAYSSAMKAKLAASSGLPVLLARSLVANVAAEVFERPWPQRASESKPARPAKGFEPLNPDPGEPAEETGAARLASALVLRYAVGALGSGDLLPSVRTLARQLRVSPTTVADWYQQLQDYGLLASKDRSGTYLHSVGLEAPVTGQQASAYRALQRAIHHFELLGMSVRDLARLVKACTDPPQGSFMLGWIAPAELCEITISDMERHLGFRPPVACLTQDEADPLLRRGLIRALLCTHADWAEAYRQARRFHLALIVLRFDTKTVEALQAPPQGTRYILTRDAAFASVIEHVIDAVPRRADPLGEAALAGHDVGRVVVKSLDQAENLKSAYDILVSPAAFEQARRRLPQATLKIWRVGVSRQTVDEIFFAYLSDRDR